MEVGELNETARGIRVEIIKMLLESQSGHTAGPLGMTDIFTALYFDIMKCDPKKPWDSKRDYLFLSNGHICPVWYATLAEKGYFPKSELKTLRKINSKLQGHPHYKSLPGIENSGGPLGQGLGVAVGAALALQQDNKPNKVFALCGDGELNEGMCWEAAMLVAKYKPKNFIQIIDRNHIQLDGPTADIMPMGDLKEKFLSFGYTVYEMDGNDMRDVLVTIKQAMKDNNAPKVIIAHTVPGKGVSFMENDYRWHGKAPTPEEAAKALEELNE